jgi:hypothetical protein
VDRLLPLLGFPISLRCIGVNLSPKRAQKKPIRLPAGAAFCIMKISEKILFSDYPLFHHYPEKKGLGFN